MTAAKASKISANVTPGKISSEQAYIEWHLRTVGRLFFQPTPNCWLQQESIVSESELIMNKNVTTATPPPTAAVTNPNLQKAKTARGQHSSALSDYDSEWLHRAETSAAAATSLSELAAAVAAYQGCEVRQFANKTVFADGNPEARLLLLGEAPGAEEDRQGLPFVGDSGKLLDASLASIGLQRKRDFLISNVLYWRPPGNRQPTNQEILLCRPFVKRLIALLQPRLIFLLGRTAAFSLLSENIAITRDRGKWRQFTAGSVKIPVLPSYHPAFLIRQPLRKAEFWQDLRNLAKALTRTSAQPFASPPTAKSAARSTEKMPTSGFAVAGASVSPGGSQD